MKIKSELDVENVENESAVDGRLSSPEESATGGIMGEIAGDIESDLTGGLRVIIRSELDVTKLKNESAVDGRLSSLMGYDGRRSSRTGGIGGDIGSGVTKFEISYRESEDQEFERAPWPSGGEAEVGCVTEGEDQTMATCGV